MGEKEKAAQAASAGTALNTESAAHGIEAQQLALPGIDQSPLPPYHTANLREIRVIRALLAGDCSREELDHIADAANVPDLIGRMRSSAHLDLPSVRLPVTDCDGAIVYRGRYRLSAADRIRLAHFSQVGGQV